MSNVHNSEKKEPKAEFAVETNLRNLKKAIWQVAYVQNFGLRVREIKMPKNASEWSNESLARYVANEELKRQKLMLLDQEFLARKRNTLDTLLTRLSANIAQANSIVYATCMAECDERRLCQDRAIGICESIRIELQDIMDVVPHNKNWMAEIEKYISAEIKLLKGWRHSDSSMRSAVRKKELQQNGGTETMKRLLIDTFNDVNAQDNLV